MNESTPPRPDESVPDDVPPPPPGEPAGVKPGDRKRGASLSITPTATLRRLNGYLHRVTPVMDETGKLLHWAVQPVMVEFKARDLAQIVVGATILGFPLVMTDEAMSAAATLSRGRVIAFAAVSLLFIAGFVYFNFYRTLIRGHLRDFVLRVGTTYVLALLTVAGLLWMFDLAPWADDWELALRRVLIVGFPASLFATVADAIK